MKGILIISYSRVDCEYIFIQVMKNQTDYREALGTLVSRTEMSSVWDVWRVSEHSQEVFGLAKFATYQHHQFQA